MYFQDNSQELPEGPVRQAEAESLEQQGSNLKMERYLIKFFLVKKPITNRNMSSLGKV